MIIILVQTRFTHLKFHVKPLKLFCYSFCKSIVEEATVLKKVMFNK